MGTHRIALDAGIGRIQDLPNPVVISGEEAHHACRVKRLEPGESVELLDGVGGVARGIVVETRKDPRTRDWVLVVRAEQVDQRPRAEPRVDVFAPAPKGARLDEMIDQLSQVGAASWTPLITERTVVEPRAGKLERLHRTATEAAKQAGRAWALEIHEPMPLDRVGLGEDLAVADASGIAWNPGRPPPSWIRLLVGPEGGWSPREMSGFRERGVRLVRFGVHTMRVETAAVVAVGILMAGASNHEGRNAFIHTETRG